MTATSLSELFRLARSCCLTTRTRRIRPRAAHFPPSPLNSFSPSPMQFVARQAFSVVRVSTHNSNPGGLRFFLTLVCCYSDMGCFQVARLLSLCFTHRKGLLFSRAQPDAIHITQLYCCYFSRRFRSGPVPQETRGIQASAEGISFPVFIHPQPCPLSWVVNDHAGSVKKFYAPAPPQSPSLPASLQDSSSAMRQSGLPLQACPLHLEESVSTKMPASSQPAEWRSTS